MEEVGVIGLDIFEDVLKNLNTWLVVLATGVVVWVIRQVIPDKIEKAKIWKILLRIIPIGIGVGIALIPGLRPIPENLAQSGAIGFIGGSMSQSVYDLFKTLLTSRARAVFASKAGRNEARNERRWTE